MLCALLISQYFCASFLQRSSSFSSPHVQFIKLNTCSMWPCLPYGRSPFYPQCSFDFVFLLWWRVRARLRVCICVCVGLSPMRIRYGSSDNATSRSTIRACSPSSAEKSNKSPSCVHKSVSVPSQIPMQTVRSSSKVFPFDSHF